jgi:putative heme-binding domain-containing protein
MKCSSALALVAASLLALPFSTHAEPQWLWLSKPARDGEKVTFRKKFTLPEGAVAAATLLYTCDNGAEAELNGQALPRNPDWHKATMADVTRQLRAGENEIVIHATNKGSAAGLVATLSVESGGAKRVVLETDATWEATPTGAQAWKPAVVIAKYGEKPWGQALRPRKAAAKDAEKPRRGAAEVALEASEIVTLPGFKAERLYVVPKEEQGSWVALTPDPKGRILACDQYGGLYRITAPPIGAQGDTKVEKLQTEIIGAHGLLYAFDSLYFMKNEGEGTHGLYRLRDANGDDQFDDVKLLREFKGGGEHGPHSIVLSPDGKSLFIVNGNHTDLPATVEQSRPARAWQEDHVIERMWDANGHARGKLAPGGYIGRMDPEGKTFELFCHGFRNQFDAAFNDLGDLFTFDADMEWDIGSPWYRPTRINHCVSGADYGWRSGAGKWPTYYPDSLPATVDIGPGSPTGVCSGVGAKFPEKYQRAIYAADWTYGTMYAIHSQPDGASYRSVQEEFVSGRPLPLTDLFIHPQDGAMYFAVGGRRSQSALYRVVYTGSESTAPAPPRALTAEAKLRRELETLHEHSAGTEVIAKALPHLGHADRFVRYAARVALERQPAAQWAGKALALSDTNAGIEAVIGLARVGEASLRDQLIEKLGEVAGAQLSREQALAATRAMQLIVIRQGKPDGAMLSDVLAHLERIYPTPDHAMNRELCQLLVALGSTEVVAKTVQLMATVTDDFAEIAAETLLARNVGYAKAVQEATASRPNRQQMWFAYCLREATTGWTPEVRKQFFAWFPRTWQWKGGNSFRGFIANIRTEALENVSDATERAALATLSAPVGAVTMRKTKPAKGPGRAWTVDEVVELTKDGLRGRSFANGEAMFATTMCATCHRFNGDGGSIGPDLTGSGARYTMRDFLENIVTPSKVISDQYESHELTMKDGSTVIGRVIVEENGQVFVSTNPLSPQDTTALDEKQIASRKPFAISLMPPGLINVLNQNELLDLIAYVMSGGNPEDKAFKK